MKLLRRKFLHLAVGAVALSAISHVARAQTYPAHPVRLISDFAAGAAGDVRERILAEGLSRVWGQQAVVINQPGAGGAIAARAAANAPPDGYSLGMLSLSAFVAVPGAADNLPVQVPRDFAPIGYLSGDTMYITAASWLGVKTLPELIARAKQRPGKLAYGTNGPGRLTDLTGRLLQKEAGIELQMVPYSGGTAQVLNDIMGKRIQLTFDAYSGLAGAIKAGTIVPLAVASPKRLAESPDVPTVAETLPGFEAGGWQVLVAPVGTPDSIVAKINTNLIEALSNPEIRKRLADLGADERLLSPAETLAFIQREQKKWEPIVAQVPSTR